MATKKNQGNNGELRPQKLHMVVWSDTDGGGIDTPTQPHHTENRKSRETREKRALIAIVGARARQFAEKKGRSPRVRQSPLRLTRRETPYSR